MHSYIYLRECSLFTSGKVGGGCKYGIDIRCGYVKSPLHSDHVGFCNPAPIWTTRDDPPPLPSYMNSCIHIFTGRQRTCVILLRCLISLPDTRWPLVHSILWPLTAMTDDSQRPQRRMYKKSSGVRQQSQTFHDTSSLHSHLQN